jgi:trehalose utilization protein
MEEVFPRQPKTDIAEVYLRQAGAGRVVYFPWDIDRTFWEVLAVDHFKLLRNAVDWATGEPRPVWSKVRECWTWPYGGRRIP